MLLWPIIEKNGKMEMEIFIWEMLYQELKVLDRASFMALGNWQLTSLYLSKLDTFISGINPCLSFFDSDTKTKLSSYLSFCFLFLLFLTFFC